MFLKKATFRAAPCCLSVQVRHIAPKSKWKTPLKLANFAKAEPNAVDRVAPEALTKLSAPYLLKHPTKHFKKPEAITAICGLYKLEAHDTPADRVPQNALLGHSYEKVRAALLFTCVSLCYSILLHRLVTTHPKRAEGSLQLPAAKLAQS